MVYSVMLSGYRPRGIVNNELEIRREEVVVA
jgi:hypothetical protein